MAYDRTDYTGSEIAEAVDTTPDHACEQEGWTGETECPGCEFNDNYGDTGWHEVGYSDPGDTHEIFLNGKKVRLTYIDGESGGEGSGEGVWCVVKIGSQYFKKDGWYASYDGTHWDGDVTEVERRQRTVTIWETRKR